MLPRGWQQASYSLVPESSSASFPTSSIPAMGIMDRVIALKDRSQERAQRVGSAGDDGSNIDDPTVYKVYKRRWIGVAIIMLLNIVFSWGYALCCLADVQMDCFCPCGKLDKGLLWIIVDDAGQLAVHRCTIRLLSCISYRCIRLSSP
jgi:hypothetical protein